MIRWLRNFPMLWRTLILVTLAVVCVLALFAYLGSDALDDSVARIRVLERQQANLAATDIDGHLEKYFYSLEYQAAGLGPKWSDAQGRESLLRLREAGIFRSDLFLLNAAGTLRLAQPALSETESRALAEDPAIRAAVQSGRRQVSNFSLDPESGTPRAFFLVPIPDAENKPTSWIGGSVDLVELPVLDLARSMDKESGSLGLVIDGRGNSLMLAEGGIPTLAEAPGARSLVGLLESGASGLYSMDVQQNGEVMIYSVAFAPLSTAGWGVAIEQPEDLAQGSMRRLRLQFVIFGAATLFMAMLGAAIDEGLVLGPIRELLAATRRLTAGDLTTPIRTTGRDETAELSRGFESMRHRLADWGGELAAAVERQTRKLSTLYAIDRVASKTLALEEVLAVSLERVLELMKMDAGAFYLAEGGTLRLHLHRGLSDEAAGTMRRLTLGEGAAGAATAEKRVVESHILPASHSAGFHAVIATPLVAKDLALGSLVLYARAERVFTPEDLDLMETIGQQIGGSVSNARLYESEQRRREQAERLYELGQEIITASTALEAARVVSLKVAQAARAHSVVVTLIDPGGQVALRVGADASGPLPSEPPPRPNGATMRVFQSGMKLTISAPDRHQTAITPRLAALGVRAMVGLPLRAGDRVIGTLFIRYAEEREFADDDERALATLANTAATALERARLLEETERRLEEIGALYDLSSAMRGAVTLQEVLPAVLQKAMRMARADAASISLVEGEEVVCQAEEGFARELLGRRVPLGQGLIGGVAATGEMRHVPFLPSDPMLAPPTAPTAVVRGVGSALCIPLSTAERVVGALLLLSYGSSHFGDNEIRLLTAAADIAGGAIHRAALFEQLEHRVHDLGSMYEFGKAVSTSLRLEEVVRLVIETAPDAVNAEGGTIFLWDDALESLVLWETGEDSKRRPGKLTYRAGEGLVGWVFLERRTAMVPEISADPRWKEEPEGVPVLSGKRARSALAVPLLRGEKALGVLMVLNKRPPGGFTETDQSLLAALAGQTAIAIENAMLFEDVRDLSVSAISSLAAAIDARDPYTRGHSEDVTKLVVELAKRLGWEGADLEMIEFAALLHDVGKIAVPDDILRKPSILVPEEWDVVYLHPYHSAQIVRPVEPLKRIVPWIYHHHERWDGAGYPDRLKGEAIPEGARIIAVVDAFNAITTERPYHHALAAEEGLKEIESHAGTQFDPKVAQVFLKMMRKGAGE